MGGWDNGSTWQWRKLRREVLARDGAKHADGRARCPLKLEGCTTWATDIHHLDGKRNGDDPSRLVATCHNCNLKVGDPNARHDPRPSPRTKW